MSDINEALKLVFPLSHQTIVPAANRVIYYDFPTSYPGNSILDPNFVNTPFYGTIADWSSVHNQGFTQEILDMLEAIEAVTGISFQPAPVGQQANLSFGFYDRAFSGGTFLGEAVPGALPDTAYVMLGGSSTATGIFSNEVPFFLNTVLHEVGHAIGLGHPFDPNTLLNPGAERTNQYTVMAYDSHPEYGGPLGVSDTQSTWSTGLMLYDIAALQSLYGVNTATNSGNTHYGADNNSQLGGDWTSNVVVVETIWDPSGDADVFDASNQTSRVILDLRQGEFSSIGFLPNVGVLIDRPAIDNVAIAFDSVIEQAIGGGANDILIGNSAKNDLDGGAGDDWLLGDGFRLVDVDSHADKSDFDIILGAVAKPIAQNEYYQGQYWSIPQDNDDDILRGGDGADHVFGGAGKDMLYGGADDDQLYGDSYPLIVDDSTAPEGTRNDTLLGENGNDTLAGGVGDDSLSGGLGGDSILGDADDFISESDHGKDTLLGGDGNDSLYGGGNEDSLDGGAGADVLYSGSADPDVDTLPGNDTLSGGEGSDQLSGSAGSDLLLGGADDDTLAGGTELDAYSAFDQLFGGDGTDHFVCWGEEAIMDAESDETFTINGLTVSGGTWQFWGKEFVGGEEGGWVDHYRWVGQYGESYDRGFIEIGEDIVPYLSIEFHDKVGEDSNNWDFLHVVTIMGWNGDGFMGITLDGEPWSFSAALNFEDVLGSDSPNILASSGVAPMVAGIGLTDPLAQLMPPAPSMPDLQPAVIEG